MSALASLALAKFVRVLVKEPTGADIGALADA
jgi:hypothetical protein